MKHLFALCNFSAIIIRLIGDSKKNLSNVFNCKILVRLITITLMDMIRRMKRVRINITTRIKFECTFQEPFKCLGLFVFKCNPFRSS